MSRCTECGAEMDPIDARQYEVCYQCGRYLRNKKAYRVRNFYYSKQDGTDRRALPKDYGQEQPTDGDD